MKSVMSHQFSKVPQATIQRSSFDRSHGLKTTINAGYLVPIFVDEALPGDTFNLNMTGFARLATPIKPLMDNLYMETFFFAVPIRLLWENWAKFNGEQVNPGDSTDYQIPQMPSPATDGYQYGSLGDYFGLPTGLATQYNHTSLFHRAYLHIYNEWFRDQNLQESTAPVPMDDGPDSEYPYGCHSRGKRHDYFTSCLPWPQKGEAVTLPITGSADVISVGTGVPTFSVTGGPTSAMSTANIDMNVLIGAPSETGNIAWVDPALQADLSTVSSVTISDMREAFQLQRMLERDARGGTRYTEVIRSHFGVTSPDSRLQRPEFLGGGHSPVNISPIAQTTQTLETQADTPQGNLAAIGTATMSGHGFTKSFTEHCVIIGLVNVRADLTYQQGLNRMWSRETRYDFYWPSLAHLGEQAVLNKEIFTTGDPAIDELVFGYQERYAEYRYKPSQITGKFRSQDPESLDIWHLSQEFENTPVLGHDFIKDDPPIERVIAVQDEPHFLLDCYFKLRCARPMPLYGVPGNIDRF